MYIVMLVTAFRNIGHGWSTSRKSLILMMPAGNKLIPRTNPDPNPNPIPNPYPTLTGYKTSCRYSSHCLEYITTQYISDEDPRIEISFVEKVKVYYVLYVQESYLIASY